MEKALEQDEYLVRKFVTVMNVAGRLQKVFASESDSVRSRLTSELAHAGVSLGRGQRGRA